ncbi:MAG: hypothetical protein QOF48_2145 [Verrucomicrobiota bacterium]|jgi:hypothetical protein
MKMNWDCTSRFLATAASLAFTAAFTVAAQDVTAFALVKEGNRHVGEEAKDRVVQIRSEKSIATLVPNIWTVVYFDPDATAKATEVRFMAGQKVSVKRPARILEPITGGHKELPKNRLKIDSDRALEIAKSEPVLKDLSLKASQLKLERRSAADETPVWKVELWAAKLNNPNRAVSIGQLFINAEDGKVVKNELKINHVD